MARQNKCLIAASEAFPEEDIVSEAVQRHCAAPTAGNTVAAAGNLAYTAESPPLLLELAAGSMVLAAAVAGNKAFAAVAVGSKVAAVAVN